METTRLDVYGRDEAKAFAALERLRADAVIVIDPLCLPTGVLEQIASVGAITLGLLVGGLPIAAAPRLAALHRVASFDPALTGARLGEAAVWRAVPPPVNDVLFGQVQRRHGPPRAMSIGRSTEHREWMLLPSKHHHDLLQVIHGLDGADLAEMLCECDVGVYVAAEAGGGFGPQAAIHLAAGHLLLAERPTPTHGLERNIDYLRIDSPDGLEWALQRLRRFPEMHHRIRVRGRLKAEQFRASRVFARLIYDLFADVAAFGHAAPAAAERR